MSTRNHSTEARPRLALGLLRSLRAVVVAVFSLAFAEAAIAQAASPPQPSPTPGDPLRTIPEKMKPTPSTESDRRPIAPKAPPGSLSDKLGKSEGVIKPPAGVDPKMDVPPPPGSQGNMPVIPPPGSPNNPAPVIPK